MTSIPNSNVGRIKAYFELKDTISPAGGRKVEMQEMRDLTSEDRQELGDLAYAELSQ